MAKNLLLLNGPNLNLLGTREPEVYGSTTLADVEQAAKAQASAADAAIATFQSNHEGALIDRIQAARIEKVDAIIINPYDIEDFTGALVRALDMPLRERRLRMQSMRRIVAGRNVFGWASDILEGLESLWTKPLQYAARAPEDTPV